MKIIKKPPKEGKSDGELLLYGLNKEEYEASVEEIDMIVELRERLGKAIEDEKTVKKKSKGGGEVK